MRRVWWGLRKSGAIEAGHTEIFESGVRGQKMAGLLEGAQPRRIFPCDAAQRKKLIFEAGNRGKERQGDATGVK
jgi:hypothetical protein